MSDTGPLAGRRFAVPGAAAATHARNLLSELGAAVGEGSADHVLHLAPRPALADWADSGAMALTGAASGPPLASPAGAASAMRAALLVAETLAGMRTGVPTTMPGVELLGERAAITGLGRAAPYSVGGAARAVRGLDGWWMLSLPRGTDHDLLAALVQTTDPGPAWNAVDRWARTLSRSEAVTRAQLLGLAAAAIPASGDSLDEQTAARRPAAVRCTPGGSVRTDGRPPAVIDLSSLWAGPLCASLLSMSGAAVIKVESTRRLDGARSGPPKFFDLMHGGHRSVTLDLSSDAGQHQLHDLIDSADVVIEASRPRALRQMGIEAQEFVGRGVTWLSITAYGRTGPWANRVGFGDDAAAAGGLVAWLDGVPVPAGDAIADPLSGAYAAAAVSAALLSDRGWLLDVSMRDVARSAAATASGPTGEEYVARAPRSRPVMQPAPAPGADNDALLFAPSVT